MSQCKVTLYTLSKSGLTKTTVATAMQSNETETIQKGILADGADYTIEDEKTYAFVLYNYDGLENEGKDELANYVASPGLTIFTSGDEYAFMINARIVHTSNEREA